MEIIVPIIRQFGASFDNLNPEQTEKLIKIGENMKNTNNISMEETHEIMNILGITTLKNNSKIKPKVKRKCKPNELCPCSSGKKFKKCCGIIK